MYLYVWKTVKQVNLSKWELITFVYLFPQDWWDSKLPEESVLCCLSVIPKVLLAGAITLMDEAYFKLAVWLNDRGRSLKNKVYVVLSNKQSLFYFAQRTIVCSRNMRTI